MTKEAAAWLTLRALGLLLLSLSLNPLFGAAGHLMTLDTLEHLADHQSFPESSTSEAERQTLRVKVEVGIAVSEGLVVGAFAFYLLRRGKAVHAMLMREGQ